MCAPRIPTSALVLGLLVGQTAEAGDGSRALLSELSTGLSLTPTERQDLDLPLARYEALHGRLGHARNALWVATVRGCREQCLEVVATGLADALAAGLTDEHASDLVLDLLAAELARPVPASALAPLHERLRREVGARLHGLRIRQA